jgi:hypothetical protein
MKKYFLIEGSLRNNALENMVLVDTYKTSGAKLTLVD